MGAGIELPGVGLTGIDKRPVSGPVEVRAPGLKGTGGSALVGDEVCDLRHHGGNDQAVYAYAREDLEDWSTYLERPLTPGSFGENLTTTGLDITGALIGERWQIGDQVVLEVATARVPCRTFATWLETRGWVRTFTAKAVPGAYLRVITPGRLRAGDPIRIVHRPDHDITINLAFRALTRERDLLPRLLVADALPDEERQLALRRRLIELDKA
ncbi:sulfurase [Kibdelosporangium phytohabitans]|uniref:Sulfurase n=1 Tax=Kibdelosporangium phytohabitans TaxID=860235 RepID=A0A0N7F2H3_9PSEU|nr:MOSC domain-containing protein [Kibdelosporangium phytohabitans]ALG05831.1 sulfurase [Kibdelosporangium phytohabitans]